MFKIEIIPVLLLFTFTFFIIILESFDKSVSTMKKDAELISPELRIQTIKLFSP